MPGVVISVETNQVAMQDTQQKLIANGENAVDLTAGERSMQEEPNFDVLFAITNLFSQHLRKQHEVVVVDPDQISILDFFRNGFGKESVGLLVSLPGRLVERDFTRVVVE